MVATYVYEWARFRPIYLWSRIYSLLYSLGVCVHQKVGFSLIKAQKIFNSKDKTLSWTLSWLLVPA